MRLFAQLAFAGILGLLVRNANASGQDKDKKKADAFEKTPVDWYGDPLPANAMARLGTTRWRHVGKGPYRTEVAALAFSPDGKTVASLGYNSVCLWERGTGRRLGEFETAPYGDGPQLTFSADSSRLRVTDQSGLRASYVRFNEVRFNEGRALERSRWRTDPDGSPGAKWARSVPGLTRRARTPEGRSYVTQEDYLVVQRDRETDRYMRAFGPLRETVRSLAISPKGKLACLLRREVVLFDIATGKEAGRISVPMHYPLALAFSPDGQTLAVGHTNGYIRMVDLKNVSAPTRITGHQTPVLALAFAPNGKWLASVSSDSLRLWDMTTGEEQRVLPGSVFGFTAMALSPDGKIMATGHERVIELWDTDTWKRIEQFPVAIPVDVLAFSPDGKTLLSNIGQVDIGKERKYRLGEGVWSNIAYSADGGTVAKTSRKGHGPFLFRPDGTKIHSFHIDLLGGPFALAPLGTSVAGATRDSTGLALYEAATGRVRRSFDTRSSVDAVAFSADARRLAGSARGVISVWDTASPTTL